MALAVDTEMPTNTADGAVSGANPGTRTFAFNNSAGTLIVAGVIAANASSGFAPVASVTYDGGALTKFIDVSYDGAGHNLVNVGIWYRLTPSTGSKNVVVTTTGNDSGSGTAAIITACITFTGNDTTTPIVAGSGKTNFRESSATTATVNSGTTTSGNIALAMMATGNSYVSTTQTLSASKNLNTNSAGGNGALTRANGTGGVINFSDTVGSDFMGMVCLEVAAASGGGGARGLFMTPSLGGVGIGGSFFRDPLQGREQLVRRDRIFVPARLAA